MRRPLVTPVTPAAVRPDAGKNACRLTSWRVRVILRLVPALSLGRDTGPAGGGPELRR